MISRTSSLHLVLSILLLLNSSTITGFTLPTEQENPLLAITEFGPVRGKYNGDILHKFTSIFTGQAAQSRVWAGIPYAEPPIGPLRFHSPVPWSNSWATFDSHTRQVSQGIIRDATEFPSPCVCLLFLYDTC